MYYLKGTGLFLFTTYNALGEDLYLKPQTVAVDVKTPLELINTVTLFNRPKKFYFLKSTFLYQ